MTGQFTRERIDTGYSQAPHGLWTLDVSVGARVLLGWLHSHSDEYLAGLTINRCRRALNTSSIAAWLDELERAGFVRVDRHGEGRPASFVLLARPWLALDRKRAETGAPKSARNQAETGSVTRPKSARVEDQGEEQLEDHSVANATGEVVTEAQIARAVVSRWWDHVKAETGHAPEVNFIGLQRIIERLIKNGYELPAIKHAIVDAWTASAPMTAQVLQAYLDGRRGNRAAASRRTAPGMDRLREMMREAQEGRNGA